MLKAIFSFVLTAAFGGASYMLSIAAEERPEMSVLNTASQIGAIITVLLFMYSVWLLSDADKE